jgi:hypothetical protein
MKLTIQLLSMGVVLCGLVALQSCDKKNGPGESIEDQQLIKLSKTWTVTSVTLDGLDKTTDYANFVLTISGTAGSPPFGFSTSGAPSPSPWPSSGNWTFGTSPTTELIRDDEVVITYSVTDTVLQLSFSYNGDGFLGRTNSVTGPWIFEFGL